MGLHYPRGAYFCAVDFIRQQRKASPMKIDAFCHILPHNFHERLGKLSERTSTIRKRALGIPCMTDLDIRFRIMDRFENYVQVLSLAAPPIESLGHAKQAAELARIANDGLSELVGKHPDRFPAFVASLPMNDPDATVREIERAIMKLGATEVQIFSNVNGMPL